MALCCLTGAGAVAASSVPIFVPTKVFKDVDIAAEAGKYHIVWLGNVGPYSAVETAIKLTAEKSDSKWLPLCQLNLDDSRDPIKGHHLLFDIERSGLQAREIVDGHTIHLYHFHGVEGGVNNPLPLSAFVEEDRVIFIIDKKDPTPIPIHWRPTEIGILASSGSCHYSAPTLGNEKT